MKLSLLIILCFISFGYWSRS